MKNIKGILSLTLVIIFLVGCSSTETMTANEFKKVWKRKVLLLLIKQLQQLTQHIKRYMLQ